MALWEYKIIQFPALDDPEEILNGLGSDRWELVSVNNQANDLVAFLKRELVYGVLSDTRPVMASSSPRVPAYVAPTQATIRVPAFQDPRTEGWVDTGLDVEGEYVGLSSSIQGDIVISSGVQVGPEGDEENTILNESIGLELPIGCLVAKVGESGKIEPVYFSGFLATEDQGRLYLTVNDLEYENNESEFIVNIGLL